MIDLREGALSPDGNDVVCLAFPAKWGSPDFIKSSWFKLVHFDLKRKRAQILDSFTIAGERIFSLAWHPTKKRILYSCSASDDSTNLEIYQFDLAAKILTRLTTDKAADTSPQWSLDGKSVVWLRGDQIYQANANGSNPRLILPQIKGVKQIQLLPHLADWSRYRKLSIEPLAGPDK